MISGLTLSPAEITSRSAERSYASTGSSTSCRNSVAAAQNTVTRYLDNSSNRRLGSKRPLWNNTALPQLHGPNNMLVPALLQPVSAVHHIRSDSVSAGQYHAETRQANSARLAWVTPFGLPVEPEV